MAPRKRKKKGSGAGPPGPEGDEWQRVQAESLQEGADAAAMVGLPAEDRALAYHCAARDLMAQRAGVTDEERAAGRHLHPNEEPEDAPDLDLQTIRMTNHLLHRYTDAGLTATGFEPLRNAMMVLGRPVQARP